MISHSVTYEDFSGKTHTEQLWFHIYKTDLAGNLDLKAQVENLSHILEGPQRELTEEETVKVLDLVKAMVKLSYGLRLDEKRFRKNEAVWNDFFDSVVYDAFMMQLFADPENAVRFIISVIPPDLRDESFKELTPEQRQVLPPVEMPTIPTPSPDIAVTELSMEELMEEMRRRQAADPTQQAPTSGG